MGMTIEEIRYRLQAMATMCTFQDAVGHDLSHKEIGLYNQAKDEAINIMRKYQKIQKIVRWNNAPSPYYKPDGQLFREICEVLEDE